MYYSSKFNVLPPPPSQKYYIKWGGERKQMEITLIKQKYTDE